MKKISLSQKCSTRSRRFEEVSDEVALAEEDVEMVAAPKIEVAEIEVADPAPLPRRRMRFSFADGSTPMITQPMITEMETL